MMAYAGERGGRRREAELSSRHSGPPCVWPQSGGGIKLVGRWPMRTVLRQAIAHKCRSANACVFHTWRNAAGIEILRFRKQHATNCHSEILQDIILKNLNAYIKIS